MIRHMIGTSEHSVSIIEFDLGMIKLHARNCSIAFNPPRPTVPGGGGGGGGGGVGQGLFAESAMIMCTGFNCIPRMRLSQV